MDDPETEVALNLICVDDSARKSIDVSIRPKHVKEIQPRINKKSNESAKTDNVLRFRAQSDKKESILVAGKSNKVIKLQIKVDKMLQFCGQMSQVPVECCSVQNGRFIWLQSGGWKRLESVYVNLTTIEKKV